MGSSVPNSRCALIQGRVRSRLRKRYASGDPLVRGRGGPHGSGGWNADPCDNPADARPQNAAPDAPRATPGRPAAPPRPGPRGLWDDGPERDPDPDAVADAPGHADRRSRARHRPRATMSRPSTRRIEEQVVAIRGLTPKRPVERKVLDEAELRATLTEQFDEDTPPEYVAANERLYKALGLMPAGRRPAPADPRPVECRRRRLLPQRPGHALRHLAQRPVGRQREDHLRP